MNLLQKQLQPRMLRISGMREQESHEGKKQVLKPEMYQEYQHHWAAGHASKEM